MQQARQRGEILTGLFYVNPETPDFAAVLKLSRTQGLFALGEAELRPPREQIREYLERFA